MFVTHICIKGHVGSTYSINGETLNGKIHLVEENNLLPKYIVGVCHEIRTETNKGVHLESIEEINTNKVIKSFYMVMKAYYGETNVSSLDIMRKAHNTKFNQHEYEFIENTMYIINITINQIIIERKLDGYGALIEIQKMSFDEYFSYYIMALQYLSNINDDIIKNKSIEGVESKNKLSPNLLGAILKLRTLIKRKIYTDDDMKANYYIAMTLYNKTPWAD